MKEILIQKLHEYIRTNNPDILIPLQEEGKVSDFLTYKLGAIKDLLERLTMEEKPTYIIEELCMKEMTAELLPSKYNYIITILAEEFDILHQKLERSGTLTYEVINLIAFCQSVFETIGFREDTEDDSQLRNGIIGSIKKYFEK
jgi:hypothetical protein